MVPTESGCRQVGMQTNPERHGCRAEARRYKKKSAADLN